MNASCAPPLSGVGDHSIVVPRVSATGLSPPAARTEQRCIHPSRSHGKTIRSSAVHQSCFGEVTNWKTLPGPGSARHSVVLFASATVATWIDHGCPEGRALNGTAVAADGTRT